MTGPRGDPQSALTPGTEALIGRQVAAHHEQQALYAHWMFFPTAETWTVGPTPELRARLEAAQVRYTVFPPPPVEAEFPARSADQDVAALAEVDAYDTQAVSTAVTAVDVKISAVRNELRADSDARRRDFEHDGFDVGILPDLPDRWLVQVNGARGAGSAEESGLRGLLRRRREVLGEVLGELERTMLRGRRSAADPSLPPSDEVQSDQTTSNFNGEYVFGVSAPLEQMFPFSWSGNISPSVMTEYAAKERPLRMHWSALYREKVQIEARLDLDVFDNSTTGFERFGATYGPAIRTIATVLMLLGSLSGVPTWIGLAGLAGSGAADAIDRDWWCFTDGRG